MLDDHAILLSFLAFMLLVMASPFSQALNTTVLGLSCDETGRASIGNDYLIKCAFTTTNATAQNVNTSASCSIRVLDNNSDTVLVKTFENSGSTPVFLSTDTNGMMRTSFLVDNRFVSDFPYFVETECAGVSNTTGLSVTSGGDSPIIKTAFNWSAWAYDNPIQTLEYLVLILLALWTLKKTLKWVLSRW